MISVADRATMIDDDGNRKSVFAKYLTEEDLGNRFVCCGRVEHDGEICEAPMLFSPIGRYFYPESRSEPHKPGCPYYRKSKQTRVSTLDMRAENVESDDLFARFGKIKKNNPEGPENNPRKSPTKPEEDDEDFIKPVIQRRRHPRNTAEFIDLMSKLPINAPYAETHVGRLIVDERNVEEYRVSEIPFGNMVAVIGRKTNPYAYGVTVESGQWLLADFWATGNNINYPILLLLNVDKEARQKLIKYAKDAKVDKPLKIGVLAKWRRNWNYTKYKVYETTTQINTNMIEIVKD